MGKNNWEVQLQEYLDRANNLQNMGCFIDNHTLCRFSNISEREEIVSLDKVTSIDFREDEDGACIRISTTNNTFLIQ